MTQVFSLPWVGTRALSVWDRNRRVWMRGAWVSTIFGELFEPIIYIFAFGYGIGSFIPDISGIPYINFIAPGAVAMSVMYASSLECTYGSFTRMDKQKTYEAIMLTPVSIEEVVAGDIFWGATKGLVGGTFVTAIISVTGLVSSPAIILAIPFSFVVGLAFAAMAQLVTALATSYDFFTYYFTVVLTPFYLLSSAFFPLQPLGPFWDTVARYLPLYHAITAYRMLATGELSPAIVNHFLWLLLYAYVAFALSINFIKGRIIK